VAIWSAAGVALVVLMRRHGAARPQAIDRAAAASHTIPTQPVATS
jgi:hypothetical protein